MRRFIALAVMMTCFAMAGEAQLIHTKGKMGVGFRGGIGWFRSNEAWNIGLMYHYYTSNSTGIIIEIDREKARLPKSKFTNHFLIGVGFENAIWKPCKWLYMNLSLAGNFGYDEWVCNHTHWTESHCVGGANTGFGLEAYPWHFMSVTLKARQFLLFGKGMNYLKPDFSLGVKYNW